MPQAPVLAGAEQNANAARLGELRAKAGELKVKLSDLDTRRVQLVEQGTRAATDDGRLAVNKVLAGVQHDITTTQVQLEQINAQIEELQTERDMSRVFSLQQPPSAPIAITTPADPFLGPKEIMTVGSGIFILLLPLVLVLARRLWVRGVPHTAMDLENSPRLQRIEQAIESIAVEVERIGEAQRFTTKLLAERQPDAMARVAPPRKEPGTITPH